MSPGAGAKFQENHVPDFKLPLSGNVMQPINPWTIFFNPMGGQLRFINVNLGTSSNPPVEQQVLSDVAGYGKQLGRIEDVLAVLLAHFRPERALTEAEDKAIRDLKRMFEDIADVKSRHAATVSQAE